MLFDTETFIIIGLGNPGPKYEKSRHNAGFIAMHTLAEKLGADISKKHCDARVAEIKRGGVRIVLAMPETYMNNSGRAFAALKNWYKADNAHIIVMYDDIDLPCGVLRLRSKGGAGTHNGMRSIISCIGGAQDFPRIRVGTGQPPEGMDLADYVLSSPKADEWQAFSSACERAADAALCWTEEGIDRAMNKYNI